jgi:hypothetical protein
METIKGQGLGYVKSTSVLISSWISARFQLILDSLSAQTQLSGQF